MTMLPAVPEQRLILPTGVRDPSGATRQLYYTGPGQAMPFEWNADQAFRLGYLANVIAYRCVQIIANAIAAVPIVVGRDRRRSADTNPNAPLARLLGPPPGGPAPKLSARKLIRWTIAQQLVTGRRAWEIETDDGREDGAIVALWPLVAARLDTEASEGGIEWFKVFTYGRGDKPVKLPPGRVFYGWDPGGLDFRQAESPLMACRFDLSLAIAADRYSVAFLRNNATPATVVTTTQFPDEEHRRRFRQQWSAEFQGPDNAGRTHFHEVGDDGDGPVSETIDVKVLGLSAKDARLVELRRDAMAEVAMALGVPWSKLDASGRTFDNAEVEDRTFWEERLLPLMEDFTDDVNMQLAPRLGGEVCWFDLSVVRALKGKPRFATIDTTAMLTLGVVMPNEVREDLMLEPMDGGDEPLEAPQAPPVAPVPAVMPHDAIDMPVEPPVAMQAPEREDRAADPATIEARRAKIWRASDAVVRTLEGRWERAFRRLFERQVVASLARLKGKRGRQMLEERAPADPLDPAAIFDPAFWADETRQLVADLFEEVATAGLNRLSSVFGVAFDVSDPWVQTFIDARANQLAGPVTDTTYQAIRDTLVEGVTVGEDVDALADRIRHVFAVADDVRATRIARTEVISAYNGSATLGAVQLPRDVVAGQEWIATRDAKVRDAHAEADGMTVEVGAPFTVDGEGLEYPGDPSGSAANTVNCRCTVAFLTPEEFATAGARAPLQVETRTALALLGLVPTGEFDVLGFRRVLEGVAA